MTPLIIPYRSGRIAVLADLHWDSYARIGTTPIDAHGLVNDLACGLDALIIAGDLANGPPQAWQAAVTALKRRLTIDNVYILPGNHDYYMHELNGDEVLERHAHDAGATFIQTRELRHGIPGSFAAPPGRISNCPAMQICRRGSPRGQCRITTVL